MRFLNIITIALLITGCAAGNYSPSSKASNDDDAAIGAGLMMINAVASGWAQGRQPMPIR